MNQVIHDTYEHDNPPPTMRGLWRRMTEDQKKYWQAVNRQRLDPCTVVKVRRLPDRFRVWRRDGMMLELGLEFSDVWPLAIVDNEASAPTE